MTTYTVLDPATLQPLRFDLELTDAEYQQRVANGKATYYRLTVLDPKPTPSATQVVERGAPLVDATSCHLTWTLRNKTQAELNADANVSDAPNIKAQTVIDNLTTRIQLDRTALTTAQRIGQLETDVVVLLKIARYYVRSL